MIPANPAGPSSPLDERSEPTAPVDRAAQAAQCLQRGVEAAGAGHIDDAIVLCRQAAELAPELTAAHANLGLLLLSAGRAAEAEAPLRTATLRAPTNAFLHNALGVALQGIGRASDAEPAFRAALAARPDYAEAHANLGKCLHHAGRFDEAQQHYARALDLQPDFAVAHYNLGVLLQDRGRHDEAIAQYRRALDCRPDYPEALNNLGNCLRKRGAIDEARAVFERLLALQPDRLEAHFNLAPLKTYTADDPQLAHFLAQRQRVPSLPDTAQTRYWFAAGKMLEDAGRYDESFAAYAEGNRLKQVRTPWDEATDADVQRRIIASITQPLIDAHTSTASADGPIPVFVVGMPRSGTSLVEQVLATLPGVHGAGEITDLGEVLQSAAADHPAQTFRFPETLVTYSSDALHRLGRRYLARLRQLAPGATHVVDKLPANFMHLGLIHLMLPNARIVHVTRDPMDACFSCYTQLFSADSLGFSYDLQALGRYWLRYDELMQHWRRVLPPGRVLDVAYENLVADFEPQARRLVDRLGLSWDESCLRFHANRRPVLTASFAQVQRPIYRSSVARGKPFEAHLAPLRDLVGPPRPPGNPPPA